MLPLCRLQLSSRLRAFTAPHFNQVHMLLVCIQLVGLSQVVSCGGPLCGPVSMRDTHCEQEEEEEEEVGLAWEGVNQYSIRKEKKEKLRRQ
eukprot:1151023-Pelagomonas_calceolata.AAC.1